MKQFQFSIKPSIMQKVDFTGKMKKMKQAKLNFSENNLYF